MITPRPDDRKWNERSNAAAGSTAHIDTMFQMLFERSADAIVLFDPGVGVFVDCNEAAVALMRAKSKEQLLNATPYTVRTDRLMRELGGLKPKTLAIMHGSSFRGDGEKAFLDLASVMKEVLGKDE